ncbi:hypothetical protein [Lactococcus garvieae]
MIKQETYFIRTYHFIHLLGRISSLILGLTLLFSLVQVKAQLHPLMVQIYQVLKISSMGLSILMLGLIFGECAHRLRRDRLRNLFKSCWGTFRLRHFLIQHEKSIPQKENQVPSKNIPLMRFNRAVRKAVLDVREDQLLLRLHIPKEVQAQKLLKAHEEEIKEHLSNLYPDYILSPFERQKFKLWLSGTRRE